ncbi:MAG: NUDIX hydrolase [Planctomycetes bacterium]|nr:NUDIX hydrolase [Planctomycetota bacterium]
MLPDGRLVLIEQYRHGAGRVFYELPAGDIDAGETPAAAAVRELAEESGYRAISEPVPLGALYPEPSRNRSRGHGFFMRVDPQPAALALDHGEAIRPCLLTVAEMLAALTDGRIAHAVQVAFLYRAHAAGLLG